MKSWSSLINLHLGEHKDTHQLRTVPGKLREKEHAEASPDHVSFNSMIVAWWYPNTYKTWKGIRWRQMPYKWFSDSGNKYPISHSQYRHMFREEKVRQSQDVLGNASFTMLILHCHKIQKKNIKRLKIPYRTCLSAWNGGKTTVWLESMRVWPSQQLGLHSYPKCETHFFSLLWPEGQLSLSRSQSTGSHTTLTDELQLAFTNLWLFTHRAYRTHKTYSGLAAKVYILLS